MKNNLIKSLFNKNIKQHLSSTNDWQLKNNLIYSELKEGLLKGFSINSSGYSALSFQICSFVFPLYIPKDYLGLSFGNFLKSPKKTEWWEYDENQLDQIGIALANIINQSEKEFLAKINNASDFYHYYKKDKKNTIRFFEAVSYSAAYAKLEVGDEELKSFLSFLKKQEEMKLDWVKKIYINTEKLIQGNRKDIFDDWESETRKALKLNN